MDTVPVPFAGSPRPTLGVEWEIPLVNQQTRGLSNTAADVLAALPEYTDIPVPRITKEFLRNTVEIVTGIHTTTAEAIDDLDESLAALTRVANAQGAQVLCAGTHPFAQWSDQLVTRNPDYDELIERTQWWGWQMLIWGVHMHIGISHKEKVWPIINALLAYYPHLLALSASSPMWAGVDTGYASNRALLFQQLPTAGLPYQFERWEQYERFVTDQLATGVISRVPGMHWDIRPAPKWGTIEVRVCDGISTRSELAALVALTHCLVVDLDERLSRGETLPNMHPWHVKENKWRAARYGLDAEIILNNAPDEMLVTTHLERVLEDLQPVAKRLHCEAELDSVARIPQVGASYQRQRAVAAQGDLTDVVDSLVRELRT